MRKMESEPESPWQGLGLIWVEEDLDYPTHPGCCQASTQSVWGLFCWLTLHSILNRQAIYCWGHSVLLGIGRLRLNRIANRLTSGWWVMFLCNGMFSPLKIACFGIFILPRNSDPLYLGKLANILKSRGGDLQGDFTGRHLELCLDRHCRCLLTAYHREVRLLWEADISKGSVLYWKCYCLCSSGYFTKHWLE